MRNENLMTGNKGMMSRTLKVAAIAAVALVPGYAMAATATTTMAVTATVLTSCTVVSAPVAFGNYSYATATDTAATGTLTVTCSAGLPYNVGLDQGASAGATVTTRKMTGGVSAGLLSYGLYRDASHTLNWGNTVGTDTLAVTGASNTGLPNAISVYGLLTKNQSSAADAYTDTVNVTVTY